MDNLIGQDVGRYHIIDQLGEGGMAVVYKAHDSRLERDVAVKFIRTAFIPPIQLEKLLKRFDREAKRMAQFTHMNIVPIIDYGEHGGMPYMVMPCLTGGTLKDLMVRRGGKPLDYRDAARLLAPVARALEYAHKRDTIHRDVKPTNILLTEENQPLLTDFGVAKIFDLDEGQTLTETGMGLGTPKYMAPEQWQNQVSVQTDIYSLGVVLYELVTGRVPYDAETPAGVYKKQLTEKLPSPMQLNPRLPDEAERVLYKALAKEPLDRYLNMGQFSQALERLGGYRTGILQPQEVNTTPGWGLLTVMHEMSGMMTVADEERARSQIAEQNRAGKITVEPVVRKGKPVSVKATALEQRMGMPGWVWGLLGIGLVLIIGLAIIKPGTPVVVPAPTEPPAAALAKTVPQANAPAPTEAPKAAELAKGGMTFVLVPRNIGNPYYDTANNGAQEAAKELGVTVTYQGPAAADATQQIQLINSLIAQKVNGLAISADDMDVLVPTGKDAIAAGIPVVSWDSQIGKEGRVLHINQAVTQDIGAIEIKMALDLTGADGGKIAILSATSTAPNQNAWIEVMKTELKKPEYSKLELVEVVYGDDDDTKSYNEALGLFTKYPDLKVIIAPTTVGIAASGRAVTDKNLIGKVFVTGLGTPNQMREYVKNGASPEFALWNPGDLGYLSVYILNALATGEIKGQAGDKFKAGRLGEYTVQDDPDLGLNVLLGLPFIYNKDNIDNFNW